MFPFRVPPFLLPTISSSAASNARRVLVSSEAWRWSTGSTWNSTRPWSQKRFIYCIPTLRRTRLLSSTSPPSSNWFPLFREFFHSSAIQEVVVRSECIPSSLYMWALFLKCRGKISSLFSMGPTFQRNTRKRSCFRMNCRLMTTLSQSLSSPFLWIVYVYLPIPICLLDPFVFWRDYPNPIPCVLKCITNSPIDPSYLWR